MSDESPLETADTGTVYPVAEVIEKTEDGKLVKVPSEANAMSPVRHGLAFWSSLPSNTVAEKTVIIKAMQGQDRPLAECVKEIISICNVVIHPVDLVNEETGEVQVCRRTVLICEDGTRIGCVAESVVNSLAAIIAIFGPPPYSPPVHVLVKQQRTRKSRNIYILEPIVRDSTRKAP